MKSFSRIAALALLCVLVVPLGMLSFGDEKPLDGFSANSSRAERQWEEKFRAIPKPENMRAYMEHLSARPHNVGTPYDKENAEWIAAKFKEWGLDTHIETFDVLFPTPKEHVEGFDVRVQAPFLELGRDPL